MGDISYSQNNRLLAFETPLGKDVLLLQELTGEEGISRLFHYDLDLLAYNNNSISFKDIVGQKCTITISLPDGTPRYINGYVSFFDQGKTDERLFTQYRAQLVPWLWFLTRQSDCRIFQNLTPPEIISRVFNLFSFKDFRLNLQAAYPKLEYCVQYRETAFNFISRLMEEYGIFYYFDHVAPGSHILVLADQSSTLPPCSGSAVSYETRVSGLDAEVVDAWHCRQEVRTGKCTLTDYSFTSPSTSLLANEPTIVDLSASQGLECFDYPGRYSTRDEGAALSKLRMQEQEAGSTVITGSGNCRRFMSGYLFTLQNHYRADQNNTYVLTAVKHFATMGETYITTGSQTAVSYLNQFTCIPSAVAYRPPRVTSKPFVQGPQPALVAGKAGEEIWVDKYGRVIVQFYWDRQGEKNENSSCWIRTSQPWAGGNWGAMWIPRVGQEVLVSFIEGDPDRPIITGRVYNADQMPPYDLPQNQTRSTFMSRSSKGGGSSNYNELRFEDKMGSEQIFINAERDMDLRVENDSREFIGNNRHLIVKANQREQVAGDRHSHVHGTHCEKIDSDMSLQIDGKQMEKTAGNKSTEVHGDVKHAVDGSLSLQVGQDRMERVGGSVSLQVGQSQNQQIGMNHAVSAGQTIDLSGGLSVVIQAGTRISLVGPGGFIDIGPTGVTIQGAMVLINSGGSPGSGPGVNVSTPADPEPPANPEDPDVADDGSKGGRLN